MAQQSPRLLIENNKKEKNIVGWYCIGHASFEYTTAFATYRKPNFIKRFFMKTLLDFYWIKKQSN